MPPPFTRHASPSTELTVRFDRETWRSEDRSFMIGKGIIVRDGKTAGPITIKGNIPINEMERGLTYLCTGQHGEHEKFGPFFVVETWALERPSSREGYVRYLMKCNGNLEVRGIGQSTADAMYRRYGPSCVEILRTDPDRVHREMPRSSLESARLCSQQLRVLEGTEKSRIALHGLLSGFGFPKPTIQKAIECGVPTPPRF